VVIDDSVAADELLAGSGAAAIGTLAPGPAASRLRMPIRWIARVPRLLPRLGPIAEAAAVRFQDQDGYRAAVLSGSRLAHLAALYPAQPARVTAIGLLTGAGSAAGALALALIALYWRGLPVLRRGFEPGTGLVRPIRRFQSGVVNDYVTWIVVGFACLCGALALAMR